MGGCKIRSGRRIRGKNGKKHPNHLGRAESGKGVNEGRVELPRNGVRHKGGWLPEAWFDEPYFLERRENSAATSRVK